MLPEYSAVNWTPYFTIPETYGDSMSYAEELFKLLSKLNNLGDLYNMLKRAFEGAGIIPATGVGGMINVTEKGAKGDGVTDNTSIIQSCIDEAYAAGGGIVFFPVGTFAHKGLVIKNNVTLMGSGRRVSTLFLLANSNTHSVSAGDFNVNADGLTKTEPIGCRSSCIQDISIDSNKSQQSVPCHGIAYYGIDLRLSNVEVKNAKGVNIYTETPGHIYSIQTGQNLQYSFVSVEAHDADVGNIYYNGQSDSNLTDILCYGDNGDYQFKCGSKGGGIRVHGMHLWGATDYGLINEGYTSHFKGVTVESATIAKCWFKSQTYFEGRIMQAGAYVEGGINTAPGILMENNMASCMIRASIGNCDTAIKFDGASGGANMIDVIAYSSCPTAELFGGTISTGDIIRAHLTGTVSDDVFRIPTAMDYDKTDGNLKLITQGTGKLQFGTTTQDGTATIFGYIDIIDKAGVARKLAVVTPTP